MHSHAIVAMETSKASLLENVDTVVGMHLTKIHVLHEERAAKPAGKLAILLMFAVQNLKPWRQWKLVKALTKNTSMSTLPIIKKTRSRPYVSYKSMEKPWR